MTGKYKRRKWYPYKTNKPDVKYGIIVQTDMGYIFEAIYKDGRFKISTVKNHKVYFDESVEQECILRWMKI